VLYAKLKRGQQFRTRPNTERLAAAMGRTKDAVVIRKGILNCLDLSASGGLCNFPQLTKGIWDEHARNPEQVFAEAGEAIKNY
jgi:hypothetical protein